MDIKSKKRYVTPVLCCYEYDTVLSVICDSGGTATGGRPVGNESAYSTTDDSGSDNSAYESQFDNNPFQ